MLSKGNEISRYHLKRSIEELCMHTPEKRNYMKEKLKQYLVASTTP